MCEHKLKKNLSTTGESAAEVTLSQKALKLKIIFCVFDSLHVCSPLIGLASPLRVSKIKKSVLAPFSTPYRSKSEGFGQEGVCE